VEKYGRAGGAKVDSTIRRTWIAVFEHLIVQSLYREYKGRKYSYILGDHQRKTSSTWHLQIWIAFPRQQ